MVAVAGTSPLLWRDDHCYFAPYYSGWSHNQGHMGISMDSGYSNILYQKRGHEVGREMH